MKQLFIVPSSVKYPDKGVLADMTKLTAGQIVFYQTTTDASKRGDFIIDKTGKLQTATAQNVLYDDIAFAYGRPDSQAITGIIDHSTYSVSLATPQDGTKFKATVKVPAPEQGLNYTVVLAKKGVVFHERNLWSVTEKYRTAKVTTANQLATSLANQLTEMAKSDLLEVKVTVAADTITIEGTDYQDWEVQAADDMYGLATVTTATTAKQPMCDKDYVKRLVSVCAQNRGFNNTLADGATIYPGYPMEVTDDWYEVYTIHYKYGRKNARTRDEAPWQDVIIAVGRTAKATANTETGAAIKAIFDIGIQ